MIKLNEKGVGFTVPTTIFTVGTVKIVFFFFSAEILIFQIL